MAVHIVSRYLLRAPLLPVRAAERPIQALRGHSLGSAAVALASPDLAAALARPRPDTRALAALARYGRRAAFRPTPHGLLAGVAVGTLGARTDIATGATRARVRPSWSRLASLGRALLDDPMVRAGARLRVAPSLLAGAGEAVWLALDDDGVTVRDAQIDGSLAAVIEVAEDATPWSAVRAAAARAFLAQESATGSDDEIDEYLLVLIDQGFLHHDLLPPLVGPDPLAFMLARLEALDGPAAAAALVTLASWADAPPGSVERARSLAALPGAGEGSDSDLHAELAHEPRRAILSRAAVARAAALAPLLFRLQEALAAPAAERDLNFALAERLDGMTEVFGAGAFDVAALAVGGYGAALAHVDEEPPVGAPPAVPVLEYLVGRLTESIRAGDDEIDLDEQALEALLPAGVPPPSFELVLAPCAAKPRAPAGTGWLLGLHAPAGASWGRFGHLLGAPLGAALAELAAAEAAARPGERAVDVVFAASPALADLSAHPPVRAEALALLGWPAARGERDPALRPIDLDLVADPSAPDALALRRNGGEPVRPSPLHRVRSTTVPGGLYRLLAGWSLVRQHAPWALTWGALAALPRLPRVRLAGFVVAPASWRIPAPAVLRGRGFARWRSGAGLPRHVQVGREDELLLVDLDAPNAARDLARHAGDGRLYEIWPPLDRLADQGGRRVEAVVAVVTGDAAPARAEVVRTMGAVPAPAERGPAPGWTTYKFFGTEERQDAVLLEGVGPLLAQARAAGEIDRWWFVRYVDSPGQRHHLRVRARARSASDGAAFARRVAAAVVPLRASGDVVALETAEHFPEIARYAGPDTAADVEWLFELDSALVLRLLAAENEQSEPPDRVELLVRSLDALTRGLGLDLVARRTLAARRRVAQLAWVGAGPEQRASLDADLRRRQRRLAAQLTGTVDDPFSAALDGHATRVQALFASDRPLGASPELLTALPAILHVCAVRLLGARPTEEAAAYYFWERILDSLVARRRRGT